METHINTLNAQMQELLHITAEIREHIVTQKTKEIAERLAVLEKIIKDQGIKLDCLGGVAEIKNETTGAVSVAITPVERSKKSLSISDYFKELWATNKDLIFERGALTRDQADRIIVENEILIKKKNGDERAIAQIIWTKCFRGNTNLAGKAIIESLKNQSKNDANRANTIEVIE